MTDGGSSLLQIEVDLEQHASYAMMQNAVPVLRNVRLTNTGEKVLSGLSLRVRVTPEVALLFEKALPAINPSASWRMNDVPLQFHHQQLLELTERIRGRCTVEVVCDDGGILTTLHLDLELLAYNEWRADTLPQLLTAFVLPNHPAIGRVLRGCKNLLLEQSGDAALDGYQSRDPNRVRAIAEATYLTIQGLGITYCNPPASFREMGQKVRTPEQILTQSIGTCLDLTLLYSACLEQVGIHPTLIILQGHAYSGAWLHEDHPRGVLWDDAAAVRNEFDSGNLLLVDSSSMVTTPAISFARAISKGRENVGELFDYMVDIGASRSEGILPLPSRFNAGNIQEVVSPQLPLAQARESTIEGASNSTPAKAAHAEIKPIELPTGVRERFERWRQRLLDISLRNSLINARMKRVVRIVPPDLGKLEDELATSQLFSLLPKPDAFSASDPRSATLYKAHTGDDGLAEMANKGIESRELWTNLEADALERKLKTLARSGRLSLEEGGAHTLYLALGMLAWYESDSSEIERLAPLILLPIELTRESEQRRKRRELGLSVSLPLEVQQVKWVCCSGSYRRPAGTCQSGHCLRRSRI